MAITQRSGQHGSPVLQSSFTGATHQSVSSRGSLTVKALNISSLTFVGFFLKCFKNYFYSQMKRQLMAFGSYTPDRGSKI